MNWYGGGFKLKFNIKKKHLTKNLLARKMLICSIITLFITELLCLNFLVNTAASETILGLENMSIDKNSSTSPIDDKQTYISEDTSISEEKTITSTSDITTSDSIKTNTNIDKTPIDYIELTTISDTTTIDIINNTSNLNDALQNERLVSEDEIVSIINNVFGDLSIDEKIEVSTDNVTSIDKIKFIPATNLKDVKATVINLKEKPAEIISPINNNVKIYKYLDIKLTTDEEYVKEADINRLEFTFKVEQNWIKDNKIDKATIILLRYHDSKWQNLNTTLINEDKTHLYYESESTGCSTFAIVGSKVVEKQESYNTEDMNIPWSIIFLIIVVLIIILIAILFKARYIYIK